MEQQKFKNQLNESLKNKDFDSIYSLFTENHYSVTELKIFYKRESKLRNGLFSKKEFWLSKLPTLFLKQILETDLRSKFISEYLKKNAFCNHKLNQEILGIDYHFFISNFKFQKSFDHDDFLESLKSLSNSNVKLSIFLKELKAIRKAFDALKEKEEMIREELTQLKFDEFLLGLVFWHSNLKQSLSEEARIPYESAVIEELDTILKEFKNHGKLSISILKNQHFQEQIALFNTSSVVNKSAPHSLLHKISSYLDETIKIKEKLNIVDLYLIGFAEIVLIDEKEIELQTNLEYSKFNLNDRKKGIEEFYISFPDKFSYSTIKKSVNKVEDKLETISFYGVPNTFPYLNKNLDLNNILTLLNDFSNFKGPQRNFRNVIPESFRELFGSHELISIFDYPKLLSGIQKYYKWSSSAAEHILSFLTSDLIDNSLPKSWLSTPFLRSGNNVIWIGTFLRDRRWENILINKLKQEKEFSDVKREAEKGFEKKVVSLFQQKGFQTISGEEFENNDGEKGEYDLLAFKDNYLFLCEMKSSIRSDDFSHAVFLENRRYEGEATHQLVKYETNIKENWLSLKKKLNINLPLHEIEIVPLIVTDTFEGDFSLYNNKHRKVSFLELDVIMNNSKRRLFENYITFQRLSSPSLKNINIQGYDLWDGNKELNAKYIDKNVKDNNVWNTIDNLFLDKNKEDIILYYSY